jgi:hypothetical protein
MTPSRPRRPPSKIAIYAQIHNIPTRAVAEHKHEALVELLREIGCGFHVVPRRRDGALVLHAVLPGETRGRPLRSAFNRAKKRDLLQTLPRSARLPAVEGGEHVLSDRIVSEIAVWCPRCLKLHWHGRWFGPRGAHCDRYTGHYDGYTLVQSDEYHSPNWGDAIVKRAFALARAAAVEPSAPSC